MNRIIFLLALFAMAPYPAVAAIEWAEWGAPVGNSVAGTFGGGQTVTLVGNFTGITHGIAAGVEYTSSPPVPGRPDNTNPPFMKINTGTPGTAI